MSVELTAITLYGMLSSAIGSITTTAFEKSSICGCGSAVSGVNFVIASFVSGGSSGVGAVSGAPAAPAAARATSL
ncbi:hypothetical protein Ctob_004861 [Chrysochromulina tobinii]|uniref:Uncharacterized protein n=1 Tax=Chrysochromulina tobinii TaxID=1460289 RepID=A0A0M0JV15_9EUKA|nr:hypothetical protein Ctob_004861 [Chrysochromulina tobinii]|eukprot:KOO29963.1 hypothetical protein Ctob_004861 [Chrysochromulina sp. CCMP291]